MRISLRELSERDPQSYELLDVRDARSYSYGHIPAARNVPAEELAAHTFAGKTVVLCCRNGLRSEALAEALRAQGRDAYALEGGFESWLRAHAQDDAGAMFRAEESIRRRFHEKLFSRFAQAVVSYGLLRQNDNVAVCISGGKDSMLMAKLFQELKRHDKFPFGLVFLLMDPGYSAENRALIERNASRLGIPLTVFRSDIFERVSSVEKSPCYLCARMRRGHLYAKAQELGCNKIALGHHFDDVIETILMGMLYGGQIQTMMPRVKSENFAGMELIRPMYLVREEDVEAWRDANGLRFLRCACRFTERSACDGEGSKRQKVKTLIRTLRREDPEIEQNIFKSVENVNLATVIAYKDAAGVRHRFDD